MGKSLSEMSLEELWQLFPIFLVEHKEAWNRWYEEEEARLQEVLQKNIIKRISHIGSTAVPNICAKDIVDILLEVESRKDQLLVCRRLLEHGWLCMSRDDNRISMNKGYTEDGFADRVYHLHIRLLGDNDELYFRDYLLEHPKTAETYEKLKLSLADKYEHNRDKYTEEKGNFIREYTELAKRDYGIRYNQK